MNNIKISRGGKLFAYQTRILSWYKTKNNRRQKFQLELAIHPLTIGKIIINYPGSEGSLDGYNNKYKTLAEYIVDQKLASVVRLPNPHTYGFGWDMNLREVLSYVLKNSEAICGTKSPELYLMGTSAGAGVIASLAWEYPEIKKILLLEPAPIPDDEVTKEALGKYTGEIYIVVGSGGEALGEIVGRKFLDSAIKASRRVIFVIPNCDHQFKGEKNGRILSQAPFYAFLDDPKPLFPEGNGGVKLYE